MSLEDSTRDELARLSLDLFNNPETRDAALPLLRKVRPGLPLPELEIGDRIKSANASVTKEVAELRAELTRRDTEQRIREARESVVDKGIVRRDEIEAVEQMMVADGITDHEKAARHYRNSQIASAPTAAKPYQKPFDHATDKIGEYFKDRKNALRNDLFAGIQSARTR